MAVKWTKWMRKAEIGWKSASQSSLPWIKSHHFFPLHYFKTRWQRTPYWTQKRRQHPQDLSRRGKQSENGMGGKRKTQFTLPFSPLPWTMWGIEETIFNAVRAPLSHGRRLEKTAPHKGPFLFSIHLYPSLSLISPLSPIPILSLWLCPVTLHGQPKNLLRISSRFEQGGEGPTLGESSPFEVSGVLPLHGGGDGGVGRMGVSERGRPGYVRGRRPKHPTPKGDDSPEACKAGQLRRCGYLGEATGSSHHSWAPKHWSCSDPPTAAWVSSASRRMRLLQRSQYAQAQYAGLALGTNLTHPGAERESVCGRFRRA